MKYRADIDGLRAIAVVSVVIFHLDITGFTGGYVGVDIFFVISGYLITSLIKHKVEGGNFRLPEFYFRRIRRLLPPLIATVAATVVAAGLIMTPYDMANFARSAVAALFSLSNIVFFFEAGYWDSASELKPLLHTWSLGVEEQFYLFWPALILGLFSISRTVPLAASFALISIVGAGFCVWYTSIDQSAAFYLLPFRIFQFSLGAMVIPLSAMSWWPHLVRTRHGLFWLGMLFSVGSILAIDEMMVFPGWIILLPTLGAMLILLAGAAPVGLVGLARGLMENRLSIWIGRASYSMYLVHWPLIVLYRYVYGVELESTDRLFLAAATIIATILMHYGVERRFYRRSTVGEVNAGALSGAQFSTRTLIIAMLVSIAPLSAWQNDGWAWRFPSLVLTPAQIEEGKASRFRYASRACLVEHPKHHRNCDYSAPVQVLVIGNSHAADGYNFLRAGYKADNAVNLIMFGSTNRCKDWRMEGGEFLTNDDLCQERLKALLHPAMVEKLDVVLYASNRPFDPNKNTLLKLLQTLKQMKPSVRYLMLGGYINTKQHCAHYINKYATTDACAQPENVAYFESAPKDLPLYEEFQSLKYHYIDRVALLCKNRVLQTCKTRTDDGTTFSYDRHHHSLEFAEMTGRLYAKKHPDLLRAQ